MERALYVREQNILPRKIDLLNEKILTMGSKRIAMTQEEETGKTTAQIVGGTGTILFLGGALGTVILGTLGQILAALAALTYFIVTERK